MSSTTKESNSDLLSRVVFAGTAFVLYGALQLIAPLESSNQDQQDSTSATYSIATQFERVRSNRTVISSTGRHLGLTERASKAFCFQVAAPKKEKAKKVIRLASLV